MGLKPGGGMDSLCLCHHIRGRMQGRTSSSRLQSTVHLVELRGERKTAFGEAIYPSIGISAWSVGFGGLV